MVVVGVVLLFVIILVIFILSEEVFGVVLCSYVEVLVVLGVVKW